MPPPLLPPIPPALMPLSQPIPLALLPPSPLMPPQFMPPPVSRPIPPPAEDFVSMFRACRSKSRPTAKVRNLFIFHFRPNLPFSYFRQSADDLRNVENFFCFGFFSQFSNPSATKQPENGLLEDRNSRRNFGTFCKKIIIYKFTNF